MTTAALLAALGCVAFALAGPRLARRLRPAAATCALTVGAVVTAATSLLVIAELAAAWIAQLPEIVDLGPWSAAKLRAGSPIPADAAIGCIALIVAAMGHFGVTGWRRLRALAAVHRCCQKLPAAATGLVVLDSERPDAFATPLPSGRIVVTTGLLRALSAEERRTLLAHERSHLSHHHAWWVLATDLAAAANPLLWWTAREVRRSVERWADEDAAADVGNRALTARTIARVALLMNAAHAAPALAATGGDVPARVRALLAAPPRRRLLPAVAIAGIVALSVASGVTEQVAADTVFDRAAATSADCAGQHC
jgi:Peptidase family M48